MRYVQSKLANMLYAQQVAERLPQFTTVSLHPGEVDTELFSREPGDDQIRDLQENVVPKRVKPVDEGVKNQLWAATTVAGLIRGVYYEPIGKPGVGMYEDRYLEMATKLWEWTEKELRNQEL